MKNLRKVLALVLAVATLMSFAVVANAAVDFDDADKISTANTMAVDILQTLKVINGKTDTTFAPQGNVTRAEIAKMIAFIMNGGKDIGELYKDSCTFADSKTHWAAGYIGYCVTMGIINGRSETVFAPQDNVTGTEAAKMMLCALGYDAGNKGMTGTNWAGNTLNLADSKNLFNKVLTSPNQALTREGAAQLLWNGMQNKTISYPGASTIIVQGVTVVQGGTETESTNTLMAQKFSGYSYDDNYRDAWHRPGYTFEGENYLDTPIITSYGPLEISKIQKIVGINGKDLLANGVTTNVWTGGFDPTSSNCSPYFWTVVGAAKGDKKYDGNTYNAAGSAYAGMTASSTAKIGTNGDYIEVYWNAGAKELDVVIFWSDAAKVASWSQDSSTKKITVTLDQTFGGTAFTNVGGDPVQFVFEADETAITKNTTYVVGYRAKLNPNDSAYAPFTVIAPEVATVTSAGFASKDGKATTLYTAEKNYTVDNSGMFNSFAVGYDYNLYMDPAGIVFYAESKQDVVETKYLYVMDTAVEGTSFGDNTYLAKVLFSDGTIEIVETNRDYNRAAGLYTYTTDKEVYTLTGVMTAASGTENIVNKGAAFGGSYFFNNKTLFVVETTVGSDKVYSTYTGINNVPTVTGDIYYAMNADNANLVDVVFVMGATETGTTAATELDVSVLFASTGLHTVTTKPGVDGKSHSYYTINAVINGSVTTVKVSPEVFNAIKCSVSHTHNQTNCEAQAGAFTYIDSYKLDANGVVYEIHEAALTSVTMTAMAGTSATSKLYKDGVITVNGTVVAIDEAVPAYVYDKNDNKFEVKTIADLTKSFSGFVLKNTDGDIVAFYGIDNKV